MDVTRRDPLSGIGKPQPLTHLGPDIWSRRITRQDRLVNREYGDVVDSL